jgi:hypothetical protein
MTLHDWLEDHPPPDAAFTQTLAGVAGRTTHDRELFFPAVRELLDELALTYTDDQRRRAIAEEPATTGDRRFDAYLGALSEHLAIRYELAVPPWTQRPSRFLDRFWFVSPVPGFRAIAVAQSPASFRRRAIFIARGSLERC